MTKRTIPTFSLARQIDNLRPNFIARLDEVMACQQFIGGKYIAQIEALLAQYLGTKNVIACNSGTDALWMALKAMAMPENAIVLTTPFSFIASSSEIVANNAHPVFIDIDPTTFNINPQAMQAWLASNAIISNGTTIHCATGFPIVGMIPVDLFGQCADYEALLKIAKAWNLWIIEDCAQGIGATFHGKKAGTFGNIGTFSFYPTKNLGAFGDAGCCVTDDPVLAEKLVEIRNHGRKNAYEYRGLGINSRMDAFQAVILAEKLPLLDAANERRRAIAAYYNTHLANIPFIKIPQAKIGSHVYHQYSILAVDAAGIGYRETLEAYLAEQGVQTRIFYPQPLSSIAFLNTHQSLTNACPITDMVTNTVMSLPMWPELEDAEVEYVVQTIKSMPYDLVTHKMTRGCSAKQV
jgi:dTDP-4-amino-4,6-dideoxygalactose transaminase